MTIHIAFHVCSCFEDKMFVNCDAFGFIGGILAVFGKLTILLSVKSNSNFTLVDSHSCQKPRLGPSL